MEEQRRAVDCRFDAFVALDASFLHFEEIGEVGIDFDTERAGEVGVGVVREREVFPHAAADIPVAKQQHL